VGAGDSSADVVFDLKGGRYARINRDRCALDWWASEKKEKKKKKSFTRITKVFVVFDTCQYDIYNHNVEGNN
jgi:hypothetical protein